MATPATLYVEAQRSLHITDNRFRICAILGCVNYFTMGPGLPTQRLSSDRPPITVERQFV